MRTSIMRVRSPRTCAVFWGMSVVGCSGNDSPEDYEASGSRGASGGQVATNGASAITSIGGNSATSGSPGPTSAGSSTTSASTSGNTESNTSGGTACTNVRPTGTEWDEATCDQWASETEECNRDWMVDNGYCNESCGRCSSGGNGSGGASGSITTSSVTTGGSVPGELDCNAAMPTGGQDHSGNGRGGSGNLAWEIWSNMGTGNMTTFDVPAFSASWNNSGDYLGRLGFEWGNNPQPYAAHGTITAQFVSRKSGTAGGFSYIGMYGWTIDPCVEWYIVDDSYNGMPVNPGNTTDMGTVTIDAGSYIMYTRQTTGTGGSRCSGVSSWAQYYSVRTTARDCGQISLTEHFDAWESLGMSLGNLLEAKILIEAGGGAGSIDFPIANVVLTQ